MNTPGRGEEELLASLRGPLTGLRNSLDGIRMERPADSLIAAGRSRLRRALILRVVAACSVVTFTAVAAVWVAGGVGRPAPSGGGIPAYTTAYVIGQVRSALANNQLVVQTTYTFGGSSAPGSATVPQITQFSYGDSIRTEQSGYIPKAAAAETSSAQGQVRLVAGTAKVNGKLTYVNVDYGRREWHPASRQGFAPTGCSTRLDVVESDGPADWPSYLRQALSCGELTYAGRTTLGTTEAIKLTGSMRGPSFWNEGPRADGASAHVAATLYVSPLTYVPVRVVWQNSGLQPDGKPARGEIREDVRLLPPTPANVAKATVSIPATFRKVTGSPFGGPVFQFFN